MRFSELVTVAVMAAVTIGIMAWNGYEWQRRQNAPRGTVERSPAVTLLLGLLAIALFGGMIWITRRLRTET